MKRKRMIIFAIILMAVGFAAVSTTLYINGVVGVSTNLDDFDVYFSGAILDGVDMSNELITDKKSITFTSKELKSVGSKSILEYEVTNGSRQYDVEARITCTEIDNPNVKVTLDKNIFTIISGEKETGIITMEMVRAVTEEESIEFSCSITASAVERNSVGDEVNEVETYSLSGTLIDKDGNKIANENLVIYSETPQYVTTDKNGFFYVNGLERGIHEIYSVGSVDVKDKTKEEIKEISTGTVRVSTNNDKDEIEIANEYKIINLKVTNGEIVEYTLTYDNAGGSGCTNTKAVIGQTWDTSCVPTKSGYTFIGWIGVPESVTGNATAIAEWEEQPVPFTVDSWETIANAVKSGNYIYKVGDTKIVDMGSFGTHVLRVSNTTPCTNGETSKTACGFVVEFADIITTHNMRSFGSNMGGWRDSEMRTYVNGTIYNALPSDLRGVIANTTVVSGHGSASGETNFTTTDKLYLLNTQEVYGTEFFDTSFGTSRQLDYYANLGVTTSNYSGAKKQYNGSNSHWWLRSAISGHYADFLFFSDSGGWPGVNFSAVLGVSPAFRIA